MAQAAASADDFEAVSSRIETACSSLKRTHVDCGCVGRRVATYLHVSPSDEYSTYSEALYFDYLGISALPEGLAESAFGSDAELLNIVAAYEPHGGMDIDFEEGCVIAEAEPATVPDFAMTDDTRRVFNSCEASTGDTAFCKCSVAARSELLSDDEFRVYSQRYTSNAGEDGTRDAMRIARAADAGIPLAAYDALLASSNAKFEAQAAADGAYLFDNRCHALLYGRDGRSGELLASMAASGRSRADRPVGLESIDVTRAATDPMTGEEMLEGVRETQQAAIDDAITMSDGVEAEAEAAARAAADDLAKIRSADGMLSAEALVAKGCAGEGDRSPAYCQCLSREFGAAVPATLSEGGKRMAALMLVGSGLPPLDAAQVANNASQADQMAAAQAIGALSSLPDTCEAEAVEADVEAVMSEAGSVRERYVAMCELQFGDAGAFTERTCSCGADYFDETLKDSEWSLLIDIQVAELKGDDNAFENYAKNIGMTRAEAEQAMMTNPRLAQAMMGFGSACMSGFGPQ